VFELGPWDYLDRVLLCGTEEGTYYVQERVLTLDALAHVRQCLALDAQRTIDRAVEFSVSGRSAKNDWPLTVLALAVAGGVAPMAKIAWEALPKVARTWSHVYTFEALLRAFGYRKWGRAHRQALWATMIGDRTADNVAYQAVKYQERGGIRGADLSRAAHLMAQAKVKEGARSGISYVLEWMHGNKEGLHNDAPLLLWAVEALKVIVFEPEVVAHIIEENKLPEQAVPTTLYKHPAVARALVETMLGTALLRNLRRFQKSGVFEDKSAVELVVSKLASPDYIKKHRLHPMQLLIAWKAYTAETHNATIAGALETALSLSFGQVEPTGKTQVIALDVSGSMDGTRVNGAPLTCIEAQTVMALTALKAEPDNVHVIAFDTAIKDFCLTPDMSYADAVQAVERLVYGGTDCSLGLQYVRDRLPTADALTIYTDSETWAGRHGFEVLGEINARRSEKPLKVATVAMAANSFSTLPPDPNHLLAVGMDARLLSVLNAFFIGNAAPVDEE
jgi:60 kDa SS-A/Ro ribonucleoprotein